MRPRERQVWAAAFGATFAECVRRDYDDSWQMGTASRLYGQSMGECAESERCNHADTARAVADAAVRGMREIEEEEPRRAR